MAKHRIAVVAGDGIGKEVMPEGIRVLEATARAFDTQYYSAEIHRAAQVLPGFLPGGDGDGGAVVGGTEFLRDDGVRPVGDFGAGHDPDCGAGGERTSEGVPGKGAPDHGERGGSIGGKVRGAYRVTVHGGVVVGWDVERRKDRFGKDAVQRLGQWDEFPRHHRLECGTDRGLGVGNRKHRGSPLFGL